MSPALTGAAIDRLVVANLRRHRISRGISTAALARSIGVPVARIRDVERGYERLKVDLLVACAQAIAVPLDRLFEDAPHTKEIAA